MYIPLNVLCWGLAAVHALLLEIDYLGLGMIIVSKGCAMGLHNSPWHLEAQSYNPKESGGIMVWVYTYVILYYIYRYIIIIVVILADTILPGV